ncbi:MAG: ATP-dependent sacrificial sulfur transferase LarE [Thermodesulfobacteriota bacterium]
MTPFPNSRRNPITDLTNHLRDCSRALLLFSGGLDSSLLLAAAAPVLGPGLTVLTFTGPQTVPGEAVAAVALAWRLQVRHLLRETDPLALPDFRHNTRQRCYVCKKALMEQAWEIAADLRIGEVWDGTNLDDLDDFRPGLQAARELGVKSPLLAAGLGKTAIREMSQKLGLPGDRPSQSCLATRFPYNTRLTREALARVGRAESWLRSRGFTQVRLRVSGDQARLELSPGEWSAFLAPEVRRPFIALAARLGWTLELDVSGGGG